MKTLRLATPAEFKLRSRIPIDKVFITRSGPPEATFWPIDHRKFLQGLHEAAVHVTFVTKGARAKLVVLKTRADSGAYWADGKKTSRARQRSDDMDWLLCEINKACPSGIYFGTRHNGEVDSCAWGFWIDEETTD